MTTALRYHPHVTVCEVLRDKTLRVRVLREGKRLPEADAIAVLQDEFARGHFVIPITVDGVTCDNFDYLTGCKGHP